MLPKCSAEVLSGVPSQEAVMSRVEKVSFVQAWVIVLLTMTEKLLNQQ